MKPKLLFLLLIFLIACALVAGVSAASPGDYSIDWWTVDGGGIISSTGGSYGLGGSIGQPEGETSTGGAYALAGGFWAGGEILFTDQIKLNFPLFLR